MSANDYDRRDQLLGSLLKWVVILGAVAYVPSLIGAIVDELFLVAVVDTVVYVALLALYFCPRAGYRVRVSGAVIATLILGTVVLFETGGDGAGHIWLLCAVFIAALFGRPALVATTVVATQLTFAVYAGLVAGEVIRHGTPFTALFAVGANMLIISIVLAAVTHSLLQNLLKAMSAREQTLKLLDHRIRNNLQTFESLIALDSSEHDRSDTLGRRVRAISTANDLLFADPGRPSVRVDRLVHALADPRRIEVHGTSTRAIPAEQLTEVSIALSDLFTLLDDVGPQQIVLGKAISITLRRPLSAIVDWETRVRGSLIPREWIRFQSSEDPHVLTIHIP
ncbi:MAG: histidine kinase dimerization/phosphoacceptor domain -containing protein [Spirochaetia bacterium]